MYSKKEPPALLKGHFEPGVFEKSQAYGRDKAKFSFWSGLFNQVLGSAMIHYGVYAYAWTLAGRVLSSFGYGPQYEVSSYGQGTTVVLIII